MSIDLDNWRCFNCGTTSDQAKASDDLAEFENEIAKRMGDSFDGDEGQQSTILGWLDGVEQKMKELSPEWWAYFFQSGPTPDSCPKCGSPEPRLHPAVQAEGEVQPCSNPFHLSIGGDHA